MIKIMTEAIQRVRGEIATPSARNDRRERTRNDEERKRCVTKVVDEHIFLVQPALACYNGANPMRLAGNE